ncbi:MAG: DMT family transporter [Spirochaetales bacterium]|nr:DMT family transporter [Spirochaetales bacterium]
MNKNILKNDFLLLLTAIIWGFAFTAQRAGMEFVGPFTFNGVRFLIGAISILPLIFLKNGNRSQKRYDERQKVSNDLNLKRLIMYGAAGGILLYLGASLQQIGMVYTTAGKAGFITGMYVIIVPILGIFFRHKAGWRRWAGALLSLTGLYFLSVKGSVKINTGDIFVLLSAFFWASHVIAISHFSPRVNALKLAFIQYLFCGILSLISAFIVEDVQKSTILLAWLPILYGSIFSVGIAYTLQVYAQKKVHPAHAAIILSLEGVFAVTGGWLILGESMGVRGMVGCILMLSGMFISQSSLFSKQLSVNSEQNATDN